MTVGSAGFDTRGGLPPDPDAQVPLGVRGADSRPILTLRSPLESQRRTPPDGPGPASPHARREVHAGARPVHSRYGSSRDTLVSAVAVASSAPTRNDTRNANRVQ